MTGPSLSRRAFMAGGATGSGQATPGATAVYSARAFVDSVGVNTHLNSEPYASRFEPVRDPLAAAHIRHVRDEPRPRTCPRFRIGRSATVRREQQARLGAGDTLHLADAA